MIISDKSGGSNDNDDDEPEPDEPEPEEPSNKNCIFIEKYITVIPRLVSFPWSSDYFYHYTRVYFIPYLRVIFHKNVPHSKCGLLV